MNGIAIVEALGNHRGQSTFEFFDFGSEFIEIVIKLFIFNIHDIVVEGLELIHGFLKFHKDLLQGFGQRFSFGAA